MISLLLFVVVLVGASALSVFAVTDYEAQHRLPPVIYSLDLPHAVRPESYYDFRWTVMGYHDTYDIIIKFYDSSGAEFNAATVSPYRTEPGEFSWGEVQSTRFFYQLESHLMCFNSNDYITLRFFASPVNDPIDNSFLSVIIPGGLGYEPPPNHTAGRIIQLDALDPGPAPRVPRCP